MTAPKCLVTDDSIDWYESNSGLDTFRKYGPCTIARSGHVFFSQVNSTTYNRKRGPCIVFSIGYIRYHNAKGEYHRTDGPAIIYADGRKEYYVNGRLIPLDEFFLKYGAM